MSKKKLNVKRITKKELEEKWEMKLPLLKQDVVFIRCNAKGEVNWEKAPIYSAEELLLRGNYGIHITN